MKILRKINKGLVLTIIVVLLLSVYLFNVEVKRNEAKPEIEKTIKEYIEVINKYAVLPEDTQKIYDSITSEEEMQKINEDTERKITEYMNQFENELKEIMIENQTAIDLEKDVLESYIREKNDFFQTVVSNYEKEIIKIKKYSFDGDQVTVTFETKINYETKYLEDGEVKTKKNSFNSSNEIITLKLVEDTWKVIYADIQYYDNDGIVMNSFM